MNTIRCNRCQGKWEAETKSPVGKFEGSAAIRVLDWMTCPHCEQTDNHWIYASDVMPTFTGSPEQIRKQQRKWLEVN
jgi:uncharacterized protein with PIN domain